MRRKFLLGIGLLAFAAAGAGSATAADIGVRPAAGPPPAVAPAFVSDWSGFYIGINGGGGWGHETFESSEFQTGFSTIPLTLPPNATPKGGVFGFQAGHNWQWGPVVGGLEIDFDGADLTSTTTFFPLVSPFTTASLDKKIDELASVRARLGYLIFPNWLLYGTTGIGFGHERLDTTASTLPPLRLEEAFQTSDLNMFGWVVGVGLEYKFANNWLIRGEWLHYDFGRVTDPNNSFFLNTPVGFNIDNGNVRTTVDVARAALSFKFP